MNLAGGDGQSMVSYPNQVTSHHNTVNITKSGYLYVYCANEADIDVFFDNLQLIHTRGPLLEVTNYYPFGLTMAGISSRSAGKVENKRRFNGIEYTTDFDLNTYDAFFRNVNP